MGVLTTAPGKESRAIRPVPNLHVGEPELWRGEHLVLNLLLSSGRDDAVVARQRHPFWDNNGAYTLFSTGNECGRVLSWVGETVHCCCAYSQ